jgi:hypothetical protein
MASIDHCLTDIYMVLPWKYMIKYLFKLEIRIFFFSNKVHTEWPWLLKKNDLKWSLSQVMYMFKLHCTMNFWWNINFVYEEMLKLDSYVCYDWPWTFQIAYEKPLSTNRCLKEHLLSPPSISDKKLSPWDGAQVEERKQQRQYDLQKFFREHDREIPYSFLFLAHLSWKLKWAILIAFCPSSVCPSVCL